MPYNNEIPRDSRVRRDMRSASRQRGSHTRSDGADATGINGIDSPRGDGSHRSAGGRTENVGAARQRPSRDALVQSYAAKDAARARNARMNSRNAIEDIQSRDGRGRHPMSTQESHDRAQMSREAYERARASRNAARPAGRTSNRELIDGRGSIDSRALNERNELIGYSIDKQDTHDPLIETESSSSRWRSQTGTGDPASGGRRSRRGPDLDRLSNTISGRNQYGSQRGEGGVPFIVKFLVALIVVLLIVLAVILFI